MKDLLIPLFQVEPRFDACVRQGSWLNLSTLWETDAEELWPCYQHPQPGSYFSGAGFAIFNTSGENNVLDLDKSERADAGTKPSCPLGLADESLLSRKYACSFAGV